MMRLLLALLALLCVVSTAEAQRKWNGRNIFPDGITFENSDTLSNATNGTFLFGRNDAGTVTLKAADDDATAALTINSGGAAALALDAGGAAAVNVGNTNATSVSICNSAACDTVTIGSNADADTITIGDATDTTVSITDDNWSVTAAGVATFPHVRTTAYSSIAATVDLTKAQAQSAGYFPVSTASGAVIVQIGEAMDAADIGSVKTFIVTATASTNALSFTADGSGVTSVMAVQGGTGDTSSCEDVGDMVRVTITATQKAIAEYFCAD